MLHISLLVLVMNRLNQTESAIFFSLVCSLLANDLSFRTDLVQCINCIICASNVISLHRLNYWSMGIQDVSFETIYFIYRL